MALVQVVVSELDRLDPIFGLEAGSVVEGTSWQVFFNEDGVPYFFNVSTKESTWCARQQHPA